MLFTFLVLAVSLCRASAGYQGELSDTELLYTVVKNYGIPLPQWAAESWDLMKEMEDAAFPIFVYTDEMKRLSGGKILGDFLNVSLRVVSGEVPPTKLLFNSAHDATVIAILAAARILEQNPHRPKYTSACSMELRRNTTTGEYGVAMVYAPSADERAQLLPVDGCDGRLLCPLDTFIDITATYSVTDYEAECAV